MSQGNSTPANASTLSSTSPFNTSDKNRLNSVLAKPRLAAIAVTLRNNEVLLVQRSKEPQRGTWGFPEDQWNREKAYIVQQSAN